MTSSSPSNTTSSYEPHRSSVSTKSSAHSSSSTSPTFPPVFEGCFVRVWFERQLTVVEHITRLLLSLLCDEGQFLITKEGIFITAFAVVDLPHSGVVEPFSNVFGEIRLWQIWTDSWTGLVLSFGSELLLISPDPDFIWHDLVGMLDTERLSVVNMFPSLLVVDFSLLSAVFPNMGLAINGVYKKTTRWEIIQ